MALVISNARGKKGSTAVADTEESPRSTEVRARRTCRAWAKVGGPGGHPADGSTQTDSSSGLCSADTQTDGPCLPSASLSDFYMCDRGKANTVTGARPRVSNHCLHCLQHPTENTPRNTVRTLPGSQRLTQGRAPTSVGRPFFAGWCGHHGTCTWSGCGEGSTVQALQGGKSATGGGMRMYMYQPSRSPQPSSLMPHQSIISVSALLLP